MSRKVLVVLFLALICGATAHAASFMEDVDRVIRLARLEGADASQFGPVRFAAMAAGPGATVRYPNGNVFTNYANQAGATLYYPNGKIATNYAMQTGATWYYSSGAIATNYMAQTGATWYYPSGQIITNYAGQTGATWYYPNGQILSNYMGQSGATWYYDNGTVMISSGPAFSANQLLDVPAILAQIMWGGTL